MKPLYIFDCIHLHFLYMINEKSRICANFLGNWGEGWLWCGQGMLLAYWILVKSILAYRFL